MWDRLGLRRPETAEETARLRAFDRLDAIADFVGICVVVALWFFLSPSRLHDPSVYGLCGAMGIISLVWHALVPPSFLGTWKLLINKLLTTTFATFIIATTGYEQSPYFFLYYLVLLGAALETGVAGALSMSAVITITYAVLILTAPHAISQDLVLSLPMWSNIVSVCVVGWIGALTAYEVAKIQRAIEQAKDRIEAFAKIDWLTGVYNRRHWDTLASQEMARAERHQRPLSLLIIDSDHMKAVNDRLGHQAGDQLLIELAAIITQQCRVSDTVIRYGGDEFVVLLPETDKGGAALLGDRIRMAVEEYELGLEDGKELQTTVSVGVAAYPENASDVWGLLHRADSALYRSKELGRNRTTVYSEQLPPEAPDGASRQGQSPEPALAPSRTTPEGGLNTA